MLATKATTSRPKQPASAHHLAGHHEHAIAGIVQRLGILRPPHMRLHHLEDEEIIAFDQRIVVSLRSKLAWHSRDQRPFDLSAAVPRSAGMRELVDLGARAVADADRRIDAVPRSAD